MAISTVERRETGSKIQRVPGASDHFGKSTLEERTEIKPQGRKVLDGLSSESMIREERAWGKTLVPSEPQVCVHKI